MSKFDEFEKLLKSSEAVRSTANEAYKKLGDEVALAHMEYFNSMVSLGKEQGFEFTADEVGDQFQKRIEELSDAQLEGVAGGLTFTAKQEPSLTINTSYVTSAYSKILPGAGTVAGT